MPSCIAIAFNTSFLLAWTCTGIFVLYAILEWMYYGFAFTYKMATVLAYYSYRYMVPAKTWPAFKSLVQYYVVNYPYFQEQKIVHYQKQPTFKPKQRILYCFHPHGVFCIGWMLNGVNFPFLNDLHLYWLVAKGLTMVPIAGDVIQWCGCEHVNKDNMVQHMKRGDNIAFLPGGFEEATIFRYREHILYLAQRKGFIKYALQYGYQVHPVYTFGEENTYHTFPYLESFRLYLNTFKVPGVLPFGWFGSILPKPNTKLITVVGKPLQLPTIQHPTKEQVNLYHEKYIACLQATFQLHRPDATLIIR